MEVSPWLVENEEGPGPAAVDDCSLWATEEEDVMLVEADPCELVGKVWLLLLILSLFPVLSVYVYCSAGKVFQIFTLLTNIE